MLARQLVAYHVQFHIITIILVAIKIVLLEFQLIMYVLLVYKVAPLA